MLEEKIMQEKIIKVKVTGEFACFTQPQLKVERMTYASMTPSAARGILDSILWKPEFKWWIHRIYLLKPIQFFSIKRNELKDVINKKEPVNIEDHRVQRNSIILKDVSYIIEASIYMEEKDITKDNHPTKYMCMFNRRIEKGQSWKTPYLGTREFSCSFEPVNANKDNPLQIDFPIGTMFLDNHYNANGDITPLYFKKDVMILNGILECKDEYKELLTSIHTSSKALKSETKEALRQLPDKEEVEECSKN